MNILEELEELKLKLAKYEPQDRKQYKESLKEYRDYYNTIETAEKKKAIEIAKKLNHFGFEQ